MGVQVWYLIAILFLVYAKGEPKDNVPRYYKQPESLSPAPAPSPNPQIAGMKEVVLYLTPEQVKSLEAAGAIVKPFPFFEISFLQQQGQQKGEETAEPQRHPDPENKAREEELPQFYKELNIQEINEDLTLQAQSGVTTTEKSRPKYKYSPKLRQLDYSTSYTQKKANKGKTSAVEYVRYLSNYENQELKNEPFRAVPLPGYSFDTQANIEFAGRYQTGALALKKTEASQRDPVQDVVEIPRRQQPIFNEPEQVQQQRESLDKTPVNNKEPVTFEEKLRQSARPWASGKVQEQVAAWDPTNVWKPVNNWEPAKIEEPEATQTPVNIQNYHNVPNVEISLVGEPRPWELQRTTKISPQTQYSSLLAPLLQHEKISESISKEKEALVNYEKEIQNNLKHIKESGSHDENKYASEFHKLSKNLEKQNVLAQRLALEITKNPQPGSSKSAEIVKQVGTPLETRIHPYSQPKQVPLTIPDNFQSRVPTEEKSSVPPPGRGNVYVKVDNPYIQKIVPGGVNLGFPLRVPLSHPEGLIIRPLWEHR